jgi:hypothetical protein
MSLLHDIPEGELVGLDTAAWIYQVEMHPTFFPVVEPFFRDRLGWGRNRAGSSLLTLGELLVQPLALGRADLADEYRSYFIPTATFAVWEATQQVVEEAAAFRVKYRLKMLDALLVASAVVNGATLFLCNDTGLRRERELKVLVVADYVTPATP